ncbi:tetraacyldisaccharide 4'-kinase [Aliidiomarina taiwanensis]|uniref:Tetraacyldisaccharide 4'-kinase n=1 Tax=Aliidiomarina taiwanensis TaxID=946228 RepID=A0A432XAP3_9GAMM|nr:tetraacyldisaccharide 4'-kinase [Aliidiomarina taiwanensis]RUO44390.1 tetraacyldisaccharide 4'-kinase [Aliidiomarina taiwanensis]
MSEKVVTWWYRRRLVWPLWFLTPLSVLFTFLAAMRRLLYAIKLKKSWQAPVPVVVVGNVTVGGTGKTPTVLAVVEYLQELGFKPGIVSRGYGGTGPFPALVEQGVTARMCGDEPLLLAGLSGVPVAVGPKRVEAAKLLLERHHIDVIITDDGLQHYALARDLEIGIVDGERGFGNNWRLPAGPLRESVRRLKKVNWVLTNGPLGSKHKLPKSVKPIEMNLQVQGWRRVSDSSPIEKPDGEAALVIAGIGNPQRFFSMVRDEGILIDETRVYPDHYDYKVTDFFKVSNDYPVLMTEKDAIKVRSFARPHWYFLKVAMRFPDDFLREFSEQLTSISTNKREALNHGNSSKPS